MDELLDAVSISPEQRVRIAQSKKIPLVQALEEYELESRLLQKQVVN